MEPSAGSRPTATATFRNPSRPAESCGKKPMASSNTIATIRDSTIEKSVRLQVPNDIGE